MSVNGRSSEERTEGGPHGARPQLAVPDCGVQAHPLRLGVLVDYERVLVAVVDDLPVCARQSTQRVTEESWQTESR